MLNKGELKALLEEHDIRPNKRLGQNFLVDKNMQHKMLASCNLAEDDVVLEIGAGLGALTLDIARHARKIFAIEKDTRLSDILKKLASGYSNIEIISQDILKFDIRKAAKGKKLKVIGNLPYYITSPIMSLLIENRKYIDSVFLTVQKEVGNRLAAGPGSKDYSPISIFTQFYTEPRLLFIIAKGVFYPQPEVDSSFLRLDIAKRPRFKVKDEKAFFKLVKTAFSKRRKTILNALSSGDILGLKKQDLEKVLKANRIDPMKRPEMLTLQDFANITNTSGVGPAHENTPGVGPS